MTTQLLESDISSDRSKPAAGNSSRTVGTVVVLMLNFIAAAVFGVLFAGNASAASTGGSGGAFTDRTFQTFTASNGLTSQYHIYAAGLSQSAALCVVFEFHGDGAYEFKNPTAAYSLGGADGIVAKSREHGCLTVPVLTPDTVGTPTWWEDGAANALYARDLINKIKAEYNINTKRIWLVGYSGGSQMITQFYLPTYSSTVDGGSAVMFGGGGVAYKVAEKPYAPSLVAGFHMHWYTGADDNGSGSADGYNALADAKASETHFAALGFATSHEYPANTAHALNGRFGAVVAQQLALFDGAATGPTAVAWAHKIVPARTGATLTVNIPSGVTRTTFRVSTTPFGTQTGFYTYTTVNGADSTLALTSNLTPGRTYYYQIETGTDRTVVASGTFVTLS